MRFLFIGVVTLLSAWAATAQDVGAQDAGGPSAGAPSAGALSAGALSAAVNQSGDEIEVRRGGEMLVGQVARPDFRPYLHPIIAADGDGVLTQLSPEHHKHQTGLYWGFTRVNGRDYFHHPESTHWRRVSVVVLKAEGGPDRTVQWQSVYDLLDENGAAVLRETQTWTLHEKGDHYLLDLQWQGEAQTDVTIGQYDYGGLFLRMPWQPDIDGHLVNSMRQQGSRAEGQRAVWVDVGMEIEGRDDHGHIAIFDHPQNKGFPQPWRVDNQLGVGPVRARAGDWTIAAGNTELIRHRLVVSSGEVGDARRWDQWGQYTGQDATYATASQWRIAQSEARNAEFLTPEKAVESMTVTDGYGVNLFASEPMVTQPIAFCWDSQGRLWVAENQDFETRGTGFSNDGNSRILILEDTDGDGVADSRQVFLEGIPFPTAIAVGHGGLWLAAPPNLLFVPDADSDDRADVDDIEVRLTGWGIRDRHETINSFLWGPDGWLYGCQGFATPSRVGKPAGGGKIYKPGEPFPKQFAYAGDPVDINGGVWRYHPVSERFEVVAHGLSNPWGLDYDAEGQMFVTACVIPHLWHIIPGGMYHRQGGRHFNAHVYSDLQTIADHRHRSAHGGARVYQSDAYAEPYRGRIFMANIHEHAVLTDTLQHAGSGYVGHHGDDFALANNAQWVGFSVEVGPGGNVFVLDWHDADICGNAVLQKDTGRVFRFAPDRSGAADFEHRFANLNTLSDLELVNLHTVASVWHSRRARVILQHRSTQRAIDTDAVETLQRILGQSRSQTHRLRALWTLHVSGNVDASELEHWLQDPNEHIRAWAIQLLCEDFDPPQSAVGQFMAMAAADESPRVRLYLASAAQRLEGESQYAILDALAQHGEDVGDHNLPNMIWFALEPLVCQDAERAIELARRAEIPMITRYVGRRLANDEQFEQLLAGIESTADPDKQRDLLRGLGEAVEGRFDMTSPVGWAEIYPKLRAVGGETARIALGLSQQFGDSVAASAMMTTLLDPNSTIEDRRQALTGLSGSRRTELIPRLVEFIDDELLRRDAIRAIGNYEDANLAAALLSRYDTFSEEEKLEIVHTLASRSTYGAALTDAIEQGTVPRSDVPAYVARLLRRVVGNRFADVWGPIESLDTAKQQQFDRFRLLLSADAIETADASAGRALFNRTCAACHRLYGHGGQVGPDITGANRGNLEYLLGNVLTPSAVIQDEYRMHIVLTDEGRIYSGIPVEETRRVLSLRVADREQPVTIAKSEIESTEIAPVSMMPDGILKDFDESQVLDLFKYLQGSKQVPLPTRSN